MKGAFEAELEAATSLVVAQRRELAELLGFETRNKYALVNEAGRQLGFAAEQGKGVLAFLARAFIGHRRTFKAR